MAELNGVHPVHDRSVAFHKYLPAQVVFGYGEESRGRQVVRPESGLAGLEVLVRVALVAAGLVRVRRTLGN